MWCALVLQKNEDALSVCRLASCEFMEDGRHVLRDGERKSRNVLFASFGIDSRCASLLHDSMKGFIMFEVLSRCAHIFWHLRRSTLSVVP
jgi:hypothetical protein